MSSDREVLHAYRGKAETELSLHLGDRVAVLEEDSPDHPGWAFGRCGAREGWYPASNVEKRPEAPAPGLRRLRSLPARLLTRLKATRDYDAHGAENMLSVRSGDDLEIISLARGWANVKLRDGSSGWLPDAVVGGSDAVLGAVSAAAEAAQEGLGASEASSSSPPSSSATTRLRRTASEGGRPATHLSPRAFLPPTSPRVAYDSEESDDGRPSPARPRAASDAGARGTPLARLSIGALKRLAADRRVNLHGCVERGDIVRALETSIRALKDDAAVEDQLKAQVAENSALKEKIARLQEKLEEFETLFGTPRARGLSCSICFDGPIQVAVFPCGHCFACAECAARVDACATCSQPITSKQRIFLAGT